MYRLNTKIHLTMLCLSGFELYSRWVPLKEKDVQRFDDLSSPRKRKRSRSSKSATLLLFLAAIILLGKSKSGFTGLTILRHDGNG